MQQPSTTHYTVCRMCLWQMMATSLLHPMQPQPSKLHTLFCKFKVLSAAKSSLVIFLVHNQFMFPSCLDFTVSLGEICCRLHLAQRQSRVPCIYFSHSSLCGFSCHFGSVLCEWCLPSGATHAGEYILPGHWKENLTSAMLILAVMSSSICGNEEQKFISVQQLDKLYHKKHH